MQKKGEKTMKREEWKRSYKRICCLLAAIGAGTALCGCSPGNGTQAVRRLEEVRFPAEPVYKNSEERWEAERNQSLPEAFLAAYSDFSYGTAAELLKDKKENTAYSPLGLYYALAAAAQGAEGKTEEEFLSLLGYDSVQELAKDCKSSFDILYHVPNKENRTGAGEEPHTSSLYSLQIANSLWADDSLPLKEAFAGRLSEYFYTDVFQGDLQSGEAGEAMACLLYTSLVTGMILGLNMPPTIPLWIPVLGGMFAIIVVKQLYGGLGQNWMNPALAARCFLLISFAGSMTRFTDPVTDAVAGATPLAVIKAGGEYDLMSMFIGKIPGTIGEVSVIALLIGAAYLLVRKVISIRIPATYILTFAVFAFIFGRQDMGYVLAELCGGGLIFGAFFMATDYVTSPIAPRGQIIFGVCLCAAPERARWRMGKCL